MKGISNSAIVFSATAILTLFTTPSVSRAESTPTPFEPGKSFFTNSALMPVYRADDTGVTKTKLCIPSGSTVRVLNSTVGDSTLMIIVGLPSTAKGPDRVYANEPPYTFNRVKRVCFAPSGEEVPWADPEYPVVVPAEPLSHLDYRRHGTTVGVLAVPFKYYIGSDQRITSSSTIAPYIGYAWSSFRGITFAPVASAGLALVPINDPTSSSTETKPALSTAFGLLVTDRNTKNWNFGFVFGMDFVGDADKKLDPAADDPWFSIFVGVPIN